MKELINTVVDMLKDIGLKNVVIAGGYPRDVVFNRKPKDADIFVLLGEGQLDADIFNEMECLADALREEWHEVRIFQAYGIASNADDFDERLYGVLKVNSEVDVLFSRAKDIPDLMDSFDSNLSQCIMVGDSAVYPKGTPTEVHTLKDIPRKRLRRLREVSSALGLPFEMRHEVQDEC